MSHIDPFNELLAGKRQPPAQPQVRTAMQGTIQDVYDTTATFVLDDYGKDHRFGPAPFSDNGSFPQSGDICLVVFSGSGVDKPWIVGWARPS